MPHLMPHHPVTSRPLEPPDFDAWWAVRLRMLSDHPDFFGSSYDETLAAGEEPARARFMAAQADRNRVFGAFDDSGTLLGVVGVIGETRPRLRHRMDIWGMYVAPEGRGTGTGGALIAASVAHARDIDGVVQIHLAVSSHNTAAIRVYERAGFRRYGVDPRALRLPDRDVDEDLMVLLLDATPVG